MLNLKMKWESLIKEETGVSVKVNTVGDDQLQVLVSGDDAFDIFNFFYSHGRGFDILDNGILVKL